MEPSGVHVKPRCGEGKDGICEPAMKLHLPCAGDAQLGVHLDIPSHNLHFNKLEG